MKILFVTLPILSYTSQFREGDEMRMDFACPIPPHLEYLYIYIYIFKVFKYNVIFLYIILLIIYLFVCILLSACKTHVFSLLALCQLLVTLIFHFYFINVKATSLRMARYLQPALTSTCSALTSNNEQDKDKTPLTRPSTSLCCHPYLTYHEFTGSIEKPFK